MISWVWLLLIFPVGWFMFFLGAALANLPMLDDLEGQHIEEGTKDHKLRAIYRSKYKQLFEAGNIAQLEKLKANEHKSGWEAELIGYLTNRIEDELEELYREITGFPRNYKAIRSEAADVANFAHMIIFKCDNRLREKKDET